MGLTPWDLVWGVWLAIFAALEIPATRHWVPWQPLSDMTWSIEAVFRPFAILVLFGLLWLVVHLVAPKFG